MASEHEDAGQAQARYDTSRDMKTIKTRQGNIAYLGVKGRVAWLRAEHRYAQIVTEKVDGGIEAGWVEFKCTITIPDQGLGPGAIATGHASETQQDFPDFYEKAETKAIGRACAALGYGTEGARDFDDGEPLDGAAASQGERAARRMEPEERAAVDAQHARNTTSPPMRLPATRRPQEPNGAEVQRQRLRAAAEAKDIILADDRTAAEWADDLDGVFEVMDSDFRVERQSDGTVTPRAIQNAILAIPAKVTA